MRQLPMLLAALILLTLVPLPALAQTTDDVVLSEEDVAYLQELTRQERAAIDRERATLQEAIDDPETIALWTARGPVVVPLRRLPAVMQMVSASRGTGDAVTLEDLALWLALDTRLELLPDAGYLTAGQARGIRDLVRAANDAAERKLDELFELARAADRFEAWLGEQPVAQPADALADVAGSGLAAVEGPFEDVCVFSTGYLLFQELFPVTHVVAWRKPDFDPSWARYFYAALAPDETAEDPNQRIERMRASVAADEEANVVFDGSFAGFCAWAAATCPNTAPKQSGSPVCEDGVPVYQ